MRPLTVPEPVPGGEPVRSLGSSGWGQLTLLWMAGIALRVTILSVPPVLPAIHRDLHLDETLVGALTALPILLLAAAAVPGSLLISRLGARRALILGLFLVTFAGAARAAGGSAVILFAMTFLMGTGIAVSQPALPSIVRAWFPRRAGVATAIYANGFLIGEILAVAFTAPLILPLVHGSWQLALVVWSLPVLATAIGFVVLTTHVPREPEAPAILWWPDWRSWRTWRLSLMLGCGSIAYYGSNAFIPDYLKALHHPGLITPALTSLNLCQLPTSFLIGAAPAVFIGKRWPILLSGALILVAAIGFHMAGTWIVLWVGVMGFATALIFVLSLALPPILAEPNDVHRLSAAMFTISYGCAFAGSLIGGAIWDATRIPFTSFVPVIAAGVLMVGLAVREL